MLDILQSQIILPFLPLQTKLEMGLELILVPLFQPVVLLDHTIKVLIDTSLVYHNVIALLDELKLLPLDHGEVLLEALTHTLLQTLGYALFHCLSDVVVSVGENVSLDRICDDLKVAFKLGKVDIGGRHLFDEGMVAMFSEQSAVRAYFFVFAGLANQLQRATMFGAALS